MRLINTGGAGMRPRGVFDPATTDYQPGDAVVEGGLPYVCTATPVIGTTTDDRSDDFTRSDDPTGWGAASDGLSTWTQIQGAGGGTIASDLGVQAFVGPSHTDTEMQLTPALAGADIDVRVKWRAALGSDTDQQMGVFARMSDAGDSWQLISAHFDGTWAVAWFTGPDLGAPTTNTSWGPGIVGTWYWLRVQFEGNIGQAKVWADGDPEPSDWQFVQDFGGVAIGRTLALYLPQSTAGDEIDLTSFSCTTSSSAGLPRPAVDRAHWALVAGTPTQSAGFGWEISDLDGNGTDLSVPITQDMVLCGLDVDVALYINALPETPAKTEVLLTIGLDGATPTFGAVPQVYHQPPASTHFGTPQSYNPNTLTVGYDGTLGQGFLCRMILKSWVPADGSASSTARHATVPLQVAASAGDTLVLHLDHLGVPVDCEVQVCVQYVPSGG